MKKLITLLCTGFMISASYAQWNPNTDQNLFVVDTGNGYSFSTTTNDGKTFIGYWKQVAAPANYELWLQILDENGNKQLGTNGIMLSNTIPMTTYTAISKIVSDSSNNVYLGVSGTGTTKSVHVFKISPQGTSVWANGINIGEGFPPSILPLQNGDIITAHGQYSQPYLKMQRFNAAGQPVWANPVEIVSNDTTKRTLPADIYDLGNNEVEIIFHKMATSQISYLFAQKLDLNGTIMWADGAKQISTQTTVTTTPFSGFADGSNVYYGYSSGQNNRFDSYLQRVNPDGSLPWGVNGVDFDTNQTNFEKNIKVAFAPGSQNIWAIANYTGSAQGTGGEYVQKFDKATGNRLFTDNAKQVFPISSDIMMHTGDLFFANGKPYFVVEKINGASPISTSLNAVLLDDNGNFAWSQQYIPMATLNRPKSYINILKPVNNRGVIVFKEEKTAAPTADPLTYAQSLVLPAATLGTSDIVKSKSIKLYPNPATDIIHLDGADNSSFVIYNAVGQLVKSGEIKKGEIAVQELAKGQYILQLKDQEKAVKFIKK